MSELDRVRELYDEVNRCREWIQAALDVGGNTHDVSDIYNGILRNTYQLWSAPDSCVVTEVVEFPNCRHLHIWLCGGNLDVIMDMLPDIEKFAEHIGAREVTSCGRHGWLKMLKPHGYERGLLCVNKKLTMAVKRDGEDDGQ